MKPKKSLKAGRPPVLLSSRTSSASTKSPGQGARGSASLSSRHTRRLIRSYHVLHKRLARARAQDDAASVRDLESQIEALGGLETYQMASVMGQSAERGGDSSRVLIRWLEPEIKARRSLRGHHARSAMKTVSAASASPYQMMPLKILEVGALSTTNALNIPGITDVRRIDLRSTVPGIEEVDFMTVTPPGEMGRTNESAGEAGYDVLSLSLVLNYVPNPSERGAMLKRTTSFLAPRSQGRRPAQTGPSPVTADSSNESKTPRLLPSLFLVLPSPTIQNSRYLTAAHLTQMMSSLGYENLETSVTNKLHYTLWRYDSQKRREWVESGGQISFRKREINSGSGRNNFCIVLDG